MNTPTPTPRTDAAWSASFDSEQISAGQTARALREHSQRLETELATLRAELEKVYALVTPVGFDLPGGIFETAQAVTELRAECDQLRADCENETKWAAHYLAQSIADKARAERAEAERDQLRADRTYNHECINRLAVATGTLGEKSEKVVDVVLSTIDQLRAENVTLRGAQKACEACDEPTAFEVGQLRAEAERTDAIYQRACEVEQELRADLVIEREKSERYRLASLKLDAELVAERAQLDWVFKNCKVTSDGYPVHDREDLGVAMKEGAK